MKDTFQERREWIETSGIKAPTISAILQTYHVLSCKEHVCLASNIVSIFKASINISSSPHYLFDNAESCFKQNLFEFGLFHQYPPLSSLPTHKIFANTALSDSSYNQIPWLNKRARILLNNDINVSYFVFRSLKNSNVCFLVWVPLAMLLKQLRRQRAWNQV